MSVSKLPLLRGKPLSLFLVILGLCVLLGFLLGYSVSSGSSPLGFLPDPDGPAAGRYEAIQESLAEAEKQAETERAAAREDREQAEVEVAEARERTRQVTVQLRVDRKRFQAEVRVLQVQVQEAEAEEAEARKELEEAARTATVQCDPDQTAGVDLMAPVRRLTQAHDKRVTLFRQEIAGLRLIVQSQDETINALQLEKRAIWALTEGFRGEVESLTRSLEISQRRFEAAEERIRQLSGRRLRLRPAAMAGAFRGINGGWSPGVGIGIALTW